MTRITDFGRKRTYLEAGFTKADADDEPLVEQGAAADDTQVGDEESKPTRKPRKRRRKGTKEVQSQGEGEGEHHVQAQQPQAISIKGRKAKIFGQFQARKISAKATASEIRRQKRTAERAALTTCLACRQQGHAVKDCPEARTVLHDDESGLGAPGKTVVGLCYRCGSTKHNLSRCKKPADPTMPLPFASCFVCSGKGHLASSCPQNKGKGIYPNGGSCKLCGLTSHLAKDCELRSQDSTSKSAMLLGSVHDEGGADEDDFHILKRRRDAVQKEEAVLQKMADTPVRLVRKVKPKVVVFK